MEIYVVCIGKSWCEGPSWIYNAIVKFNSKTRSNRRERKHAVAVAVAVAVVVVIVARFAIRSWNTAAVTITVIKPCRGISICAAIVPRHLHYANCRHKFVSFPKRIWADFDLRTRQWFLTTVLLPSKLPTLPLVLFYISLWLYTIFTFYISWFIVGTFFFILTN